MELGIQCDLNHSLGAIASWSIVYAN